MYGRDHTHCSNLLLDRTDVSQQYLSYMHSSPKAAKVPALDEIETGNAKVSIMTKLKATPYKYHPNIAKKQASIVLYLLYVHVAGSLRESEPGPVGICPWMPIPRHRSFICRLAAHTVIYNLCLSSFTNLVFSTFGRKLLCEMHQTTTKLAPSKGWTSYPQDFEALSVALIYLVLLLALDNVFFIVPAIWALFSAKGPQFSSRPRFFVAVATTMDVISYLVFVWSWNTQLGFQ